MNLQIARQKFFAKYPNTFANFSINERLNKPVCFVFDYCCETNKNLFITPKMQEEIKQVAKHNNEEPMYAVIDYFGHLEPELAEQVSTFYYESIINETKYNNIEEVCNALNAFMDKNSNTSKNTTNRSIVSAYLLNPDGTLDDQRIFYMEVTFNKLRSGHTVCTIENTFTEEGYKGNGLHSYGVKFLENVLAKKGVLSIIGESLECDVYQSENDSTLAKHYQNLGFEVSTDSNGVTHLLKDVDPQNNMQITLEDDLCR